MVLPDHPELLRASARLVLCYAAYAIVGNPPLGCRMIDRATELLEHAAELEQEERLGWH